MVEFRTQISTVMRVTDDKSLHQSAVTGQEMHSWAADLFPLNRSITGPAVRQTLRYFNNIVPELQIRSLPSGSRAFDWEVPEEWTVSEAWIGDESGRKVVDFHENNLHLLGYSVAVDRWMTRGELDGHLHSLPEQPDAIPYLTSYYNRTWGFCLSENQRRELGDGKYRVVIRSEHKKGELNYGEVVLPGRTDREVLLSTNICHPSMANNELSGPVVTAALAHWLRSQPRRYTYRIVFVPETIGSIVYLSRYLDHLKAHVDAGFNVVCVGDDRCHSYLPSRAGNTLSDRAARHVLGHIDPDYVSYTWLDRGSDERQYCAPGVDLPVASILRSKFECYPEYHTSLDNLDFISPSGLIGGFQALQRALHILEHNMIPSVTVLCEPHLGRRGLYPTMNKKGIPGSSRNMRNFLSYCDGTLDLIAIADKIGEPAWELLPLAATLSEHGLIETEPAP